MNLRPLPAFLGQKTGPKKHKYEIRRTSEEAAVNFHMGDERRLGAAATWGAGEGSEEYLCQEALCDLEEVN